MDVAYFEYCSAGKLLRNDLETNSIQHSVLGNRLLINKYMEPLLGNTFANKHVPAETIGVQQ
jgi:hypothetical protein